VHQYLGQIGPSNPKGRDCRSHENAQASLGLTHWLGTLASRPSRASDARLAGRSQTGGSRSLGDRFCEFYNYGDGTTVGLDLDRRRDDGEYALSETHAGAWTEYVEDVEGDFGTFLLDLVRERLAYD
jgi:hypothetical protein